MKKIVTLGLIFLIAFSLACICVLYLHRNSNPVITCIKPDDNIRPRNYCLMNPFRDKQAENIAEDILKSLRNGEIDSILPYLAHLNEDNKNHILKREKEFQVTNWRIGRRIETADEFSLMYWTSRKNYEWEEEVGFDFACENDEWKLKYFSAIY
ncbi:MAG: hypothetical protein M3525_07840 [Acidobacteriota bacterium]|nr:hypothetical protein [Acidobacteriota bacterium]